MARTPDKADSAKPRPAWLCVFEETLPDVPRRVPDKPHVRVEQKSIRPGPELEDWLGRARRGKRPELVSVRNDLMPQDQHRGGLCRPYKLPEDRAKIDEALKKLRGKLRCAGFTVNADTTLWSLYVIALNDSHLTQRPEDYRGYVYVGQTAICPIERAKQHELGPAYPWRKRPAYSRVCHKYFRQYVPDLLPKRFQKKLLCRDAALRAELALREHFVAKRYEVEGGTELLADE